MAGGGELRVAVVVKADLRGIGTAPGLPASWERTPDLENDIISLAGAHLNRTSHPHPVERS